MKEIKSFEDLRYIVRYHCNVYDIQNHEIDFVLFLSMKFIDILNIFNKGWTYQQENF